MRLFLALSTLVLLAGCKTPQSYMTIAAKGEVYHHAIVKNLDEGWKKDRVAREAAAAVIPAAICGANPALRIIGIVNVPVVTAFATALPESEPMSPLPSTETLAGPPGDRPKSRSEKLMMNCVAPVTSRNAPKITNRNTYLNMTPEALPKTPCPFRDSMVKKSAFIWVMRPMIASPLRK